MKSSSGKGLGESASTAAGGEAVGGGRCLSWCKEKWWGMVLAVGEGTEGEIKVTHSLWEIFEVVLSKFSFLCTM